MPVQEAKAEPKPKTGLDIQIEFLDGLRTSAALVEAKVAAVRADYVKYVEAVQAVGGTPMTEDEMLSSLLGFPVKVGGVKKSGVPTGTKMPLRYAFRWKDSKQEITGEQGEQFRYAKRRAKIISPELMRIIGKNVKNVEMFDTETGEAIDAVVEFSANSA